ncbi:hypothetical protein ASE36_17225 [Rhizobium sp. Root274]|uniref:SH3 domain-containing protein n=1 Tax=unclassified Rhizobium TaxID=2613769 RepID=UPI0007123373|nr:MULTISPECIES: SH3 domain-containing protein [unclassified Rhizobium]KQW28171.1 hypothetical protein ASC71_17255 [Rhizobium sp. Root1240]KRD28457.1 hypothetical protein ASE36_17225 [Rhizobium sp. Root274]
MKKLWLMAAVAASTVGLPVIAEAAPAFSTGNVNMRSGPSTQYPPVIVIPVGSQVDIRGCLSSANWCDVAYAGYRGWVSGSYLQASYSQRRVYVDPQYYRPLGIPTVTFSIGSYWDDHYRNRSFYRDRDRWRDNDGWRDRDRQRERDRDRYRRSSSDIQQFDRNDEPQMHEGRRDNDPRWKAERPRSQDAGRGDNVRRDKDNARRNNERRDQSWRNGKDQKDNIRRIPQRKRGEALCNPAQQPCP